jgi:hypothetical protein
MPENTLTFSELRKIQKQEKREEKLSDLDKSFVIEANDYLETKKNAGEENREYRNAKRVYNKVISIREKKIVKKARLAAKTDVQTSTSNFLPREQELFRELKEIFGSHRKKMERAVEEEIVEEEKEDREKNVNKETEPESVQDDEENESSRSSKEKLEETDEGYKKVEIVSEVPEFMGTDLETYGPFDQGEKTSLPEENAEILANRGNAKILE